MINFIEQNQPQQTHSPGLFINTFQSYLQHKQEIFAFLRNEEKLPKLSSFFSQHSLSQDIIKVTNAQPDICLEAFYALYHVLWPQIEKQSNVSLKDAWKNFLGGPSLKGILWSPEKLMCKKRPKDIKEKFSENEGESQVFQDLDRVVSSILHLRQKINDYPSHLLQKEEIIKSLDLLEGFYKDYRNRVKELVQAIIEKKQRNVECVSEYDALEDLLQPKAIMMSDIFDHHWAYRIPRSKAQKMLSLDEDRNPIKSHSDGPSNHRVMALPENSNEPVVYFKANGDPAIQPGKEFMLYSLYRHLQIPAPETALIILTDAFETNSDYFYAVQASEAVIGESALKACQNQQTVFEKKAYVEQVIGALLTNPSDGSFKNFQYSPIYKTLIGIDNDAIFQPELKGDNKTVDVKSVLYLLPLMDQPIPASVQTYLITLDPHLVTLAWLYDLDKKDKEYQLLFNRLPYQKARQTYQNFLSKSESPPLLSGCLQMRVSVDIELGETFSQPRIVVSKNLLSSLGRKLEKIERTLLDKKSASCQILFEEISPILGKYYQELRLQFQDQDLQKALEALWGDNKDDVKYNSVSFFLKNDDLNRLRKNEIILDGDEFEAEKLFEEYKIIMQEFQQTPLDRLIKRHSERKIKNILNLEQVLKELQFLKQADLVDLKHAKEVVDFLYEISKIPQSENILSQIRMLIFTLPNAELQWLLTVENYFMRRDQDVPKDSKTVQGVFMKQRIFAVSESETKYIFDKQDNIRKNPSLTGRSCVTCFPAKDPQFYLKQYPEWPCYEFASTLFMRMLGITNLPYQDLLIMNSSSQENSYPVLLSQKVDGKLVLLVWHEPQAFQNLDPFQTGLLIISAMLLNPEDGKEDNFILSEDGKYLIPIDNDHCFLPGTFQKEGNLWNAFTVNTAIQTKTLVFCLDEMMKPVPLEVKEHILSIDFDSLLTRWMSELVKIEDRCNNLVDQDQQIRFLEHGTIIRSPFYSQFIHNLHWKAHKIQEILEKVAEATPFDLLKAVEPFAARCYGDSFKQEKSLQNRFKAVTSSLYTKTSSDGSRVSILNTRSMMEVINISESDLRNDKIFQKRGPLDVLELLNDIIKERNQKCRTEQEKLFEIDDTTGENKWGSPFGNSSVETALKDFLSSQKEGLILKGSKIITSSKLTELFAQAPNQGMRIRFLSIPESPLLTSREIRILAENCPNIEYLNICGCGKLKEVRTEREEWLLLARLEAQECFGLEKFVSYSPLKILRIGASQKIEVNVEKSSLDVFTISTEKNKFEFSLKKDEHFEIKFLEKIISNDNFLLGGKCEIEEIEKYFRDWKITIGEYSFNSPWDLAVFVTCLNLNAANIQIEDIKSMVTLKLANLNRLDLSGIRSTLEYLIQGKWPKLCHIDLSSTETNDEGLEILSQGNWPLLEALYLKNNNITAKGIKAIVTKSKWSQLKSLDLSYNKIKDEGLEKLSEKSWPRLENLQIKGIEITSMGVEIIVNRSKWLKLKSLDLSENEIKDKGLEMLSQGNWPRLESLYLQGIEITAVGIDAIVKRSKWPELKHLNFSDTSVKEKEIAILSQGNWPLLETLDLKGTKVARRALSNFLLNSNWPNFKKIALSKYSDDGFKFIHKDLSMTERLELNEFQIKFDKIEIIINKNKNRFPELKCLNLSDSDVSLEIIETLTLVECPLLEELHIQNMKNISKWIEVIVNQPKWTQLRHINISNNEISGEELSMLARKADGLEILNLSKTRLSSNGIKAIILSKWLALKSLDLSDNEIFDEGISVLTLAEWPLLQNLNIKNTKITAKGIEVLVKNMNLPNLKKLNISENEIFDEGLEISTSANWPLFQHLVNYDTKVTPKGNISLLANSNWPNLCQLEHSLYESFLNSSEMILAMVPISSWTQSFLVIALDINWLNSKEIYLTIKHDSLDEKVVLFPRDKLHQFEEIQVSFPLSVKIESIHQTVVWPSNVKALDLSNNSLSDEKRVESLLVKKCPILEDLRLVDTSLTPRSIEILIKKSYWLNLKSLNISYNAIQDEGLEILVSAKKWPLLENLNLEKTEITARGMQFLAKQSDFPNLKKLNISYNAIFDEGLEILVSARWAMLETLYMRDINVTKQGIESMINRLRWPSLKVLDLSCNSNFLNKQLETFISRKLPNLRLTRASYDHLGEMAAQPDQLNMGFALLDKSQFTES